MDRKIIIIIGGSRITNPIYPEELKNIAFINEVTIKVVIPEGIEIIRVARYTGVSEKSAFKNGKIGNKVKLPKKASTNDKVENIAL